MVVHDLANTRIRLEKMCSQAEQVAPSNVEQEWGGTTGPRNARLIRGDLGFKVQKERKRISRGLWLSTRRCSPNEANIWRSQALHISETQDDRFLCTNLAGEADTLSFRLEFVPLHLICFINMGMTSIPAQIPTYSISPSGHSRTVDKLLVTSTSRIGEL